MTQMVCAFPESVDLTSSIMRLLKCTTIKQVLIRHNRQGGESPIQAYPYDLLLTGDYNPLSAQRNLSLDTMTCLVCTLAYLTRELIICRLSQLSKAHTEMSRPK